MLAEVLDPEMEWEPGFGDLNAGVHHGADGFRGFVDSWLESFDDFRIQPGAADPGRRHGDRRRASARPRAGERDRARARVVHVWTIRDGKARGWWGPRTLDEALDALGDEAPRRVLRGYEAFNRGDLEEALASFDPEITWHTVSVPGPGRRHVPRA